MARVIGHDLSHNTGPLGPRSKCTTRTRTYPDQLCMVSRESFWEPFSGS